ncbi:MAG TPA: MCE family protein [Solirubrobacteraceae bacterium]|nr:MCE family protein [Solirubrobacteraceae bacterium]
MVTQAPKRSAVFAALAFALSCVGLIIFVWTQFGGTVPFGPQGYRVNALFRESGLLVPNADVRIAGVTIGKVQSVQARGLNSLVTMEIEPQYAPIPVDTQAILRQKTLLGEAYVSLSTGTGSGPKFADGGTIPTAHVQATQALDQVLGSFDKPTQQNFQALLNGTAVALAGRGQTLNDAIGNLDPTVTGLAAMVGVLNNQRGDVQRLINGSATVLSALGSRSSDLQSLVTAGDAVLATTAGRNTALTATVNALPPFLAQLRTTLGTLNTTLGIARPTLAALRPVAPLLTPTLREVVTLSGPATRLLHEAPRLLADAGLALPAITRFTNAFHPAIDQIVPAAREVVPIINLMSDYRQELVAAMSNLGADLEATAPANTTSGKAHYLRAISSLGRESIFGQAVREPTTRSNPYFSPGELANMGRGLYAATCANTGNSSQVPIGFGNVPCRVQPKFHWGNGIPDSYYPHLTRAPKP